MRSKLALHKEKRLILWRISLYFVLMLHRNIDNEGQRKVISNQPSGVLLWH